MKHATSRELYDYWDRLRRGQPAPHRSDIEPSDIRRILADTFILEVADRETYAIRLAGTRICATSAWVRVRNRSARAFCDICDVLVSPERNT